MAAAHTFRSAIGGFNREDVVHYIEYIRSKHEAEIAQLKAENQAMKDDLAALKAQPVVVDLSDTVAALEQERDNLLAQVIQLHAELSAKEITASQALADKELEAYRRAERAERIAKERAQTIYDQANGILADATVHVDEAASQIGLMTDKVAAQLSALQEVVGSSKEALTNAAATLAAICAQPKDAE